MRQQDKHEVFSLPDGGVVEPVTTESRGGEMWNEIAGLKHGAHLLANVDSRGAGLAIPGVHDGGSLAGNESARTSSIHVGAAWTRASGRMIPSMSEHTPATPSLRRGLRHAREHRECTLPYLGLPR